MTAIYRTDTRNPDFLALVQALDAELAIRDGEEHAFYDQFNKLDHIRHVVVAYYNDTPVGCGAIKEFSPDTIEVKRMFVPLPYRGQGIATMVLQALETWARELGYAQCILETGVRQPEAIALYHKNHYQIIQNYGQYRDAPGSVCFAKKL